MRQCGVCGQNDSEVTLITTCKGCDIPICDKCHGNGAAPQYKRGYKGNYSTYCSIECLLDDTNWSPGTHSFDRNIVDFAAPATQTFHSRQIQLLVREHRTKQKLKKRFK